MDYLKVTYRDIAKMLASAIPVEGEEFGLRVEANLEAIKAMPIEAKTALKVAYVFSRKVPREEREDLFQDLALAVFKAKTKDEKLAYTIARLDWLNWWKRYKIRQHTSLDSVIEDTEGNPTTLADMLVGEVEFETKVNGKMDADLLWSKLPEHIKPLVLKKLEGKALTAPSRKVGRPKVEQPMIGKHRVEYSRWLRKEAYKLLPEDTNRLEGESELSRLNRWLKSEGYKLVLA
ncbi:hypothetical protein KKE60_04455 [Patescibacteria group bacterium]|nr:hypothetical protein [Patescibacteria group bacterium]